MGRLVTEPGLATGGPVERNASAAHAPTAHFLADRFEIGQKRRDCLRYAPQTCLMRLPNGRRLEISSL